MEEAVRTENLDVINVVRAATAAKVPAASNHHPFLLPSPQTCLANDTIKPRAFAFPSLSFPFLPFPSSLPVAISCCTDHVPKEMHRLPCSSSSTAQMSRPGMNRCRFNHRDRQTERQTDRHTERERETDRQRERDSIKVRRCVILHTLTFSPSHSPNLSIVPLVCWWWMRAGPHAAAHGVFAWAADGCRAACGGGCRCECTG